MITRRYIKFKRDNYQYSPPHLRSSDLLFSPYLVFSVSDTEILEISSCCIFHGIFKDLTQLICTPIFCLVQTRLLTSYDLTRPESVDLIYTDQTLPGLI